MAFRGEVHHHIGPVLGKDMIERGTVADIGVFEGIKRAVGDRSEVFQAGGIGQCIEVDHAVPARNRKPDHCRSDKAGTAGDEDFH